MNHHRPLYPASSMLPMLRALMLALGLSLTLASVQANAAEEDVTQNDPARWYQGDDTPQLHYKNLLKEAHAAHAEALQECRALHGTEARNCRQQARRNYSDDKARAQRILAQLKRSAS